MSAFISLCVYEHREKNGTCLQHWLLSPFKLKSLKFLRQRLCALQPWSVSLIYATLPVNVRGLSNGSVARYHGRSNAVTDYWRLPIGCTYTLHTDHTLATLNFPACVCLAKTHNTVWWKFKAGFAFINRLPVDLRVDPARTGFQLKDPKPVRESLCALYREPKIQHWKHIHDFFIVWKAAS